MSLNIPQELVYEILKNLSVFDILKFVKIFDIPKDIINLEIFRDTHTILESVLMADPECEDLELLEKLIKNGANPLFKNTCGISPCSILLCHYNLGFIDDNKLCKICNIFFPNKLSFTRSGKCYTSLEGIFA